MGHSAIGCSYMAHINMQNITDHKEAIYNNTDTYGLRNTFLRDTRTLVEEQLHLHTFPTHLLLILKDLIKFRLGISQPQPQPLKQHTKENSHKHFLKVKFHNKGIEMINLNGILRSRRVKATIPVFFQHNEPPTVSYKYTKTLSSILEKLQRALTYPATTAQPANAVHQPLFTSLQAMWSPVTSAS